MAKLPKYTLSKDEKRDDWKLTNDATDSVLRRSTRRPTTAGGVLERTIGSTGGSVNIEKESGRYQGSIHIPAARTRVRRKRSISGRWTPRLHVQPRIPSDVHHELSPNGGSLGSAQLAAHESETRLRST